MPPAPSGPLGRLLNIPMLNVKRTGGSKRTNAREHTHACARAHDPGGRHGREPCPRPASEIAATDTPPVLTRKDPLRRGPGRRGLASGVSRVSAAVPAGESPGRPEQARESPRHDGPARAPTALRSHRPAVGPARAGRQRGP